MILLALGFTLLLINSIVLGAKPGETDYDVYLSLYREKETTCTRKSITLPGLKRPYNRVQGVRLLDISPAFLINNYSACSSACDADLCAGLSILHSNGLMFCTTAQGIERTGEDLTPPPLTKWASVDETTFWVPRNGEIRLPACYQDSTQKIFMDKVIAPMLSFPVPSSTPSLGLSTTTTTSMGDVKDTPHTTTTRNSSPHVVTSTLRSEMSDTTTSVSTVVTPSKPTTTTEKRTSTTTSGKLSTEEGNKVDTSTVDYDTTTNDNRGGGNGDTTTLARETTTRPITTLSDTTNNFHCAVEIKKEMIYLEDSQQKNFDRSDVDEELERSSNGINSEYPFPSLLSINTMSGCFVTLVKHDDSIEIMASFNNKDDIRVRSVECRCQSTTTPGSERNAAGHLMDGGERIEIKATGLTVKYNGDKKKHKVTITIHRLCWVKLVMISMDGEKKERTFDNKKDVEEFIYYDIMDEFDGIVEYVGDCAR